MKMTSHVKKWRKLHLGCQSGQIIIIAALFLVVLIGFLGLATDIGYLRYMKREMQKAADAGAVAGASELKQSGSHIQAARALTAKNGFTHNPPDVTVEVNKPPQNGAYAGQNGYVEVIIHTDQPTFFMKVLGINKASDLQARAVAGASPESGACIYALSPDTKHSTLVNGGTSIMIDCPIRVNSNSPDAFNAACQDDPSVVAQSVCVTGGVTSKTIECTEPDPSSGPEACPPVPDPLADLAEPGKRPYKCDYIGCEINDGVSTNCSLPLRPGIYCDGIRIAKTDGVEFRKGMYILNGGGLWVSDATVYGDGVTFYNTGDETYDFDVIRFAKDTEDPNAILRAPKNGTYKGILFFQDHNNTRDAKFSSHACAALEGTLYFHSTTGEDTLLEYNGATSNCEGSDLSKMVIIGDVLHFQSHSAIFQNYPMDFGGGSAGLITLVE